MEMFLKKMTTQEYLDKNNDEKTDLTASFYFEHDGIPFTAELIIKGDDHAVKGVLQKVGVTMVGHIIEVDMGKNKQQTLG